ncbi:unnamed protein product [Boreogadus saida]
MSNRRDRGLWRRRAQRGGGEQLTAEGQHPNHSSSSSGFRTADSDRMVQPAEELGQRGTPANDARGLSSLPTGRLGRAVGQKELP